MFDGDTDYYRLNRRLKMRRWRKNLPHLWALLIIPLGFTCWLLLQLGKSDPRHAPPHLTMASPGMGNRGLPQPRPAIRQLPNDRSIARATAVTPQPAPVPRPVAKVARRSSLKGAAARKARLRVARARIAKRRVARRSRASGNAMKHQYATRQ
jgi:hypothetical protein